MNIQLVSYHMCVLHKAILACGSTHEFTQVLVVLSKKMSLFMYNFTSSKQKEATKASSSEITGQSDLSGQNQPPIAEFFPAMKFPLKTTQ
jgi:hypothetical protein